MILLNVIGIVHSPNELSPQTTTEPAAVSATLCASLPDTFVKNAPRAESGNCELTPQITRSAAKAILDWKAKRKKTSVQVCNRLVRELKRCAEEGAVNG